MARNYPFLREELYERMSAYSGKRDDMGVKRPTENAAMRELPGIKQKEYTAVRKALDVSETMNGSGSIRVKLVDMVYFQQSHTLYGAAMALHISERTAKRYNGDFLRAIGVAYGFLEKDGTPGPK